MSLSLTDIPVKVPEDALCGKTSTLTQRKVIEVLRSNGFEEARSIKHNTFKKTIKSGNLKNLKAITSDSYLGAIVQKNHNIPNQM